ncbi:MAG: histidine phosphatase family protein [Bacteroidales bacterium]|nr:histidine phosphatase family protein [Bacteroidales bacterium]
MQQRIFGFLHQLVKNNLCERALLIAHGGVLNVVIRAVLGIPFEEPRRFHIPNTGINIFTWEHDTFFVKTIGDISHLKHSLNLVS